MRILELLASIGFVEFKNGSWFCTENNIHISKDSNMFLLYHQQWRQKCITSLDSDKNAINYTSLYTISKDDQVVLKNMIFEFIEKTRSIVINSEEQKLMCFALDFFEVKWGINGIWPLEGKIWSTISIIGFSHFDKRIFVGILDRINSHFNWMIAKAAKILFGCLI